MKPQDVISPRCLICTTNKSITSAVHPKTRPLLEVKNGEGKRLREEARAESPVKSLPWPTPIRDASWNRPALQVGQRNAPDWELACRGTRPQRKHI